ncbi:phosphotransferase family protein [Amycolatopsis sp. FU40]|uniref:phosphotransferase family protein n=1 Tax=Amycolatopsis sp. FU40 TaxID=2914159 RepID=UPI001F30F72F|nr:phosphotransferase family protein [Amycolatopsis sp. FU40]UKD51172.1 phosphotransferase family protein [Amycolatopsis sp. FU40]
MRTATDALDTGRLIQWLAGPAPDFDPSTASVSLISGGRSNLTFEVTDGKCALVVRRPPLGHVHAAAHDMRREFRAMVALAKTGVPVPEVIGYCDDRSVLGAPFLVMRKSPGRIYRTDDDLGELDRVQGTLIAHALVDTLANLHSAPWASIGLADFGRSSGYLDRQLRRWASQLAGARERPLPGIDRLADLLAEHRPAPRPSVLVHGDYRLDNVLIGTGGEITAVLDWEMSTIGDPLADVGTFCMYWDGFADLGLSVPCSPGVRHGWPAREELARRYTARSGNSLSDLGWYVAFGYYRIAVILEGVHARHRRGLTAGSGFDGVGDAVPQIVARGLEAWAE